MNLPSNVLTVLQTPTSAPVTVLAPLQNSATPGTGMPPLISGGQSFDGSSESPLRSTSLMSLNSWWEINIYELRSMQLHSRALRNSLPIFRNVVKNLTEFTIGWGLIPLPKSGNKDFDRRAKAYWRHVTGKKSFDVRHKQDHCAQQVTAFSDTVVDGEFFRLKKLDGLGRPVRQGFRSEQCGLFGNIGGNDGWWNGIRYGIEGPALEYMFRHVMPGNLNFLLGEPQIYDARHVQHIYDLERSNQNRGLPWCYSGLTAGRDSIDLGSLDMALRKLDTVLFGNIETPQGNMPNAFAAGGGAGGARPSSTLIPFPTPADFPATGILGMEYYAVNEEKTYRWNGTAYVMFKADNSQRYLDVYGVQMPLFRTGEKLNFSKDSKSLDNLNALDREYNVVASAFGLPADLFWNLSKNGGASVRGTFELGRRTFQRGQRMMIDCMCQDDYENVISQGILAYLYPRDYPGVEPLAPPPGMTGWDVCTWRGPEDMTVDKGRDGKMYLELMRAGAMSREEWWTRMGEDPDEMEAVPTRELAARYQEWLANNLPEAQFWLREFGATGSLSITNDPNQTPGLDNGQMDAMADKLAGLLLNRMK